MKWGLLFAHWRNYGETWSVPEALVHELEFRGHEVIVKNLYAWDGKLDLRQKIRKYSNEGFNQLVSEVNRGEHFDVIMVMDYGPWQCPLLNKSVFPNSVLIKESGDEPQSHKLHLQTAHQFDIVLSPDYPCVQDYYKRGIHAVWQPHFADERIFYPRPEIPIQFECVTTCGPRGNGLTEKIQQALGDRFNNERYFYGEDHPKRLSMGKIVFQCSQFKEITRRVFEGMACGKMVVTDKLPDYTHIDDLFIENEDIVYYSNDLEAIEKIKYYLENDKERERIARNGMEKVLSQHTVAARVDELETVIQEILIKK